MLGAVLAAFLAVADPAPPAPAPEPHELSGQVRGTVSYGRHQPAAGAIVIVRAEGALSPIRAATTGDNGSFAFNGVADGTYRATIAREGYLPVVKTGLRVRAPFRAVIEVVLQPGAAPNEVSPVSAGTASVTGTVRTAGGSPAAEARVRLARPDGAAEARVASGGDTGGFAITDLPAGRWRLDVRGAGLLPLRADLDLAGDVSIDVQLAAQPATYKPLPQDLLVPEQAIPPPGTSPASSYLGASAPFTAK